jgi:hypothetical protein
VHRNVEVRLNDVEDPGVCRASLGACSIVRNAAQRDREAWLDQCPVRMRAGDESEEAKQGRQRRRPHRELACRYLPGIRSALPPV